MSDKEEPVLETTADEFYAEGSKQAVTETAEKFNDTDSIVTKNLTMVNHHHNHFYGNPNANPNTNVDGSLINTLVKIGLGVTAIYAGTKLISSGGNDIKRLEEDRQKLLEAKEENEIKTLALHDEDKYSWYRYDDKSLTESNNIKTDKQYLFSIYESKDIVLCLFNRENPIYSKFGEKDITINNPSSNIIYRIFQERTTESKIVEEFKVFFYIEEVVDEDGTYDSHYERENDIKVKRAQYKVTRIDDEFIKLEFINIK